MSPSAIGASRFEQSFVFHMIQGFFLLLLAVAVVEMAIRYAALRWDFARAEPQRVDRAAQQLANDIRSIMLNAGGPVAAQTVYPILNRNHDDLGLSIAVEPFAVTVASMQETRGMDVQGLPAQAAQLLAAREGGAFDARLKTLLQMVGTLAGTGSGTGAGPQAALLHDALQWQWLQASFQSLAGALQPAVATTALAEAQSAGYRAFAQALHEMAALEATMQAVAVRGQQVLLRLAQGRQTAAAARQAAAGAAHPATDAHAAG